MTYVSSGNVRIHVRILATYVCYRRTHSVDVRDSATYVFGTTLLKRWIRDYAVEIEDSGKRFWSDRFGTTQNILDFGSDEEDRRGLVFRP